LPPPRNHDRRRHGEITYSVRRRVPAFVVLQQLADGRWRLLGEFDRKPGMTAKAARSHAILEATGGKAQAGEVYAAVLRSEWRVAIDWQPP
jgi:hypothetical protein